MSRESKRLKTSSSDWLTFGNALIQRVKNAIFVFLLLQVMQKRKLFEVAYIVKRLLIAYFLGIIFLPKMPNSVHVCQKL